MKINFLFFGIILLNSACVVQYNVTDTAKKLKSSVESANTNCASISTQIQTMQKEYLSLKCKTDAEPFQTAQKLLADINTSLSEVQNLKTNINTEYTNFTDFTKGKNTIASNTPEWKKWKQTKKKMKSYIKLLQNKSEETIKKATSFTVYASTTIAPSVQMCDVQNYTLKYDQTMASFTKSQETAYADLKRYQGEIKNATSKYRTSQAIKIQTLAATISSMEAEIDKLETIKLAIVKAVNQFKVETRGKQKIYSCSPDWEIILRVEGSIATEQKEIQNIQTKLLELAAQIQNTINTLE